MHLKILAVKFPPITTIWSVISNWSVLMTIHLQVLGVPTRRSLFWQLIPPFLSMPSTPTMPRRPELGVGSEGVAQRWGIYPWARRTHCPNGFNSQCPISIHCPPTVNPSGPSSHQLGMLYDNTLQTHLYLTNIFRIVTIYGTDASSRVCLKSSNFIQSSWHTNTEKYKKAPRQVLVN